MNEKKKKYNVAIVGCGSMGVENMFEGLSFPYSFFEAATKSSRAELVALIDSDTKKLREISDKLSGLGYGRFQEFPNLRTAIGETTIDIVCCAAGPKINSEVIRSAKLYGIKGVYCEKPLCLSLAEADELAEIEKNSGIKIQVNYLRNHDVHHRAVVEYIRKGGICELLTVRVLYKGGVLAVFSHTSALLMTLFDKQLSAFGVYSPLLNTRCPEDPNIDGVLRYYFAPQSREVNVQVTATGRGEMVNNTYLYEFEFTGTKERITILENGWRTRYETMELSKVFAKFGELMPYDATIPTELKADTPREFMVEGLNILLDAVEGGTATTCNAAFARDAEEAAHALAISAAQFETVALPLTDRTYAFANSRAGVKLLKEEAGIKS